MSVYKPAKSRFWHYDFVIEGRRVHGSTGQTTRRAAEAWERKKRLEIATGQHGQVAKMTLNEAAGRWWAEKGIGRGDAVDVERRIGVLLQLIGKNTVLGDIDQPTVAAAVEKRRGITLRRGKAKDAKEYAPSNSTVNRDVIETLRPILKRARTHWAPKGAQHGLPEIDWTELRLKEPRGQSRMYSDAERAAWLAACEEPVDLALDLLLTNGLRFGELFFPPDALNLDPESPTLTLQKGRKRDVILHVPLRLDHARRLAALSCQAKEAGLDHLWFYRAGRKLVPLTYSMLEYRISKAADVAGVKGSRRIHGARHHAASRVLSRTGNLKAVQGLLGHASIHSSQRYAHVLTSELRAALEDDISRNSPEPAGAGAKQVVEK